MRGLLLAPLLAPLLILVPLPIPRKYFHQGGPEATGISFEHGSWLSGSSASGLRGKDIRSHAPPEEGTGSTEVQTACLGHRQPRAEDPTCSSQGRPSIHPAFCTLSNASYFCVLPHLCWIFSISLHIPFPTSSPSCFLPRGSIFMDIFLAFWIQPMRGASRISTKGVTSR